MHIMHTMLGRKLNLITLLKEFSHKEESREKITPAEKMKSYF